METEENKIEEFCPTLQFTVLLYLYFVILLTLGASSIMHLFSYGYNYFIINSSIPRWSVVWDGAISTLNILYGLKAITLALKGHRCAVSAMRWSLWVCFFYSACENLGRLGQVGMGYIMLIPIILIMYSLFFWLYMLMSKSIKKMYLKSNRKRWVWGTMGKILFLSYILWYAVNIYTKIDIEGNSKIINPSQIKLNEGEVTDGMCISHPLSIWKIQKNSKSGQIYCTVDSCRINTGSIIMNSSDRLSFNMIIGQEMLSKGLTKGLEMSYCDTILKGKKFYSSKYDIINLSDSASRTYFMSAALFDNKSKKVAILSVVGETPVLISYEDLVEYMKSVDFELKKRIIKNNGVKDE